MAIAKDKDDLPSSTASGSDRNASGCGPAPKLDQETVLLTLKDRLQKLGQRLHEVRLLFYIVLCILSDMVFSIHWPYFSCANGHLNHSIIIPF